MGVRFRVIKPHRPESEDWVSLKKGAKLRFERRPTEWEGWIWCSSSEGRTAWVPESWVNLEGAVCVMVKDYVSREISVDTGDEVDSEFGESGWAWVRTAAGEEGWVPLECLEKAGE
jgi:hypothetical protein